MSDELDLSAWEAPAAPADLADIVIGRVANDTAPISVPVEPRAAPRRALLIGGVAAAVIAGSLGMYALVRSARHAAPTSGTVVADQPRVLALETARATLDPGANVQWHTDNGIRVTQRGTATWQVDRDEKLVIDAALASIEARGASLRVEVQMNSADAKIIGASAVTSMAVAMVTVVVYEGYVKVQDHAQTVVVQPGSTFQTKPPELVGVAPPAPPPAPVTVQGCGEVDCVLSNYEPACCAQYRPESLDRSAIQEVMLRLEAKTEACATKYKSTGKIVATVKVSKEGAVEQVTTDRPDVIAPCLGDAIKTATFGKTRNGATFTYPFTFFDFGPDCDAAALKDQGMELISHGDHKRALQKFEKSNACKSDPYVTQLMFMEACSSQDTGKAKLYYKQLSPAQQARFSQICIRNNTAYRDEEGTLDLRSTPPARIEIDRADTGKTTPAKLSLLPGKHRVTLVVGVDKFTYSVNITAGESQTMVKQLQ